MPLAWTVVACVLLTAGWVVYKVMDPFAGQRQRAVQDLLQQWGTAPQHARHTGAGTGSARVPSAMGIPATATLAVARLLDRARLPGDRGMPHPPNLAGTSPVRLTRHNLRPDRIRPVTGKPFALIRILAFGRHWGQFAVVEGTALSQLALPRPGSCAGHRACRPARHISWWQRMT